MPARDLVVEYLYFHGADERFNYPNVRARSAHAIAVRYLECALVQTASLRLQEVDVDIALVTNLTDHDALGKEAARLLEAIASYGVEMLVADYEHHGDSTVPQFQSSRYVLDAIVAAADPALPDRRLWFTDTDCVWHDAAVVSRAARAVAPAIGVIVLDYPPDYDINGITREGLGQLGARLGDCEPVPPLVGGELITGTSGELVELVSACEVLDRELAAIDEPLSTEQQLFSLAGGLGRLRFADLSEVAQRVQTGPRHGAPRPADPAALGLWHLPAEKGLSLRRTARELARGRSARLRRDLGDSRRAMRRFNVAGAGRGRRVRDDGWLAVQRLRNLTSPAR